MTYYIYNSETKYEIYALSIYYSLRQLGYNIHLTNKIEVSNLNDIYYILGGEYIINIPKKYIIIQTIPTSNLTISDKLDAYWMSNDYIILLKNAIEIWDIYQENINVWKNYYNFKNVNYLPFGYNHFICERINKNNNIKNNNNNLITILGNERAESLYNQVKDLSDRIIGYYSINNQINLINELINKNTDVLLISDYINTFPDKGFVYALRYNNIKVIVEKTRDTLLNQELDKIGCTLIPWIKITKQFKISILSHLINNNTSICKKEFMSSILPITFYEDIPKIIDKPNKKKLRKNVKEITNNLYSRNGTKDVEFNLLDDGGISLSIGDIPDKDLIDITILTPTANRRHLFSLPIRNFLNFNYPKEKLNWIILDNGEKGIQDIVPRNKKIIYEYINPNIKKLNISQMRNRLVEMSNTDIVMFMDDDDYYPPESIIARTKCLLKYKKKGINCVGCRDFASYDLINGICALCSNGADYLCESSLTFYKNFWLERKFNENNKTNEARYFLEGRQHQIRSIPFQYITLAFTHNSNTTGNVRSLAFQKKYKKTDDWELTKKTVLSILDEDTQTFINLLKKEII